ncbi:DNA-binding NarL/FixJ family response regulator [Vibrio sp. ES.051]|uniref:LuxR C-terminal-related transcriptional regulator n=1 Tax=Vibrio sp. ES.051 TaxID=1761909 RepID=UPI000BF58625|nr:LuxR C-terminal-related transcriptional regulator [Vibrio sp. ES.051]PFG58037.1 DNA-binding NarL/FixJ family response regulator [Vibrio sp. ES.051]
MSINIFEDDLVLFVRLNGSISYGELTHFVAQYNTFPVDVNLFTDRCSKFVKSGGFLTLSNVLPIEKYSSAIDSLFINRFSVLEHIISTLNSSGFEELYKSLVNSINLRHHLEKLLQLSLDINGGYVPLPILEDLVKRLPKINTSTTIVLIKIFLVMGKFEHAKICYNISIGEKGINYNSSYGEIFVHNAIKRLEKNITLSIENVYPLYMEQKIDFSKDGSTDLIMGLAHELFLVSQFDDCLHVVKDLVSICQRKRCWVSLYYGYFLEILCLGMKNRFESAYGRYRLYSMLSYTTKNMQHILDVAIVVVSIWCCAQDRIDREVVRRVENFNVDNNDNIFQKVYTIYSKMLLEANKEVFSVRKFIKLERKLIYVYQHNQVSESWNIPDFSSVYELANLRSKNLKVPILIQESFVTNFYQESIRNYINHNDSFTTLPIFFVGLNKTINNHMSNDLTSIDFSKLTKKELEVLDLLRRGYSYSDVCTFLSISINTVKSHAYSIYKKLKISGRNDLIRYF